MTGDKITDLKEDLSDVTDALSYEVTEDIYNMLMFTSGYMGKGGSTGTASTLKYSNKIPVKTGDVLSFLMTESWSFRFVTAFNGESAIIESGAENIASYTVPEGIDGVVVTIYSTATNSKIYHTHDVLVDVVSMKSDVDTLDVDALKTDVDALKTDVDEALLYAHGYYNNTTLRNWYQTAQIIVYFRCRPNAEYTINKNIETPVFQICYIKEEPQKDVTQPIYNYTTPTGNTDITYTTGDDALYVLMLCGNYIGDINTLISAMSATSRQILLEDNEARTIITYDEAYLPNHMYIIVNKDYEIYHSQICPKAENYTFKWNSGSNYGNRVRLKYDSTGDKTLQCTIYNADGTLAKQLSTTVHVVNIASGNIHLLPFGDSLTNHCVWESELMNMAENIVCVGSRSRSIKDSDEEARTVYDEGRAGFSSFSYTTGARYAYGSDAGGDELPHNRWYDPTAEKFSTDYYFENYFPSDQIAPDVITFFLGMNDLAGTHTVDEIVANIKSMIDNILAYNNTLKIVLLSPQLRYLPTLDGAEQLRFTDFAKAMEALARTYSNMVYLPLLVGMDSTNNYNMVSVTINTRNPKTEEIASDITHPAYVGYWQIADYVLGAISYLFN